MSGSQGRPVDGQRPIEGCNGLAVTALARVQVTELAEGRRQRRVPEPQRLLAQLDRAQQQLLRLLISMLGMIHGRQVGQTGREPRVPPVKGFGNRQRLYEKLLGASELPAPLGRQAVGSELHPALALGIGAQGRSRKQGEREARQGRDSERNGPNARRPGTRELAREARSDTGAHAQLSNPLRRRGLKGLWIDERRAACAARSV
jgi:hypothetical protein